MFTKPSRVLIKFACLASLLSILTLDWQVRVFAEEVAPQVTTEPGRRASAGRRDGCVASNKTLTALIPEKPQPVGLTTAANPTFFFYIPNNSVKDANFILYDDRDQEIYSTTIELPKNKSGIMSWQFTPKANSPTLAVGKNYRWRFTMICVPKDHSKDLFVTGLIQRVPLNPELTAKLEKASLEERLNIYAKAGIWHETLATLAELRRQNPENQQLVNDWANMLKQIGLNDIADEPLLKP
jgi:hypothetical protein